MPTIAINPKLLTKLAELEARCQAVTEQMNDPAVATNATRIVKLAKEHAQLGRILGPYNQFKYLQKQIDDSESMLADATTDAELRELAEAELPDLRTKAAAALEGLIDDLIVGDDAAYDSIIMEIRAGTGGDEAALFARDLFEMYSRYAAARGFSVETLDASTDELGGFREVILNIKGPGVYTHFGYEGGGHRVQRVPQTETQGRIHTSAATVAVLPEVEETDVNINWDKDVLEHVAAAGGPGGQNVNKVATAIRLEHIPTGITVHMRDERSQHKNRAKARRILASRVQSHYQEQERAKRDSTRKAMIGSGDRNARIRTYNFPQDRCTDHRVNENFPLEAIIAGRMDDLVSALRRHDRQRRLESL